MLHARRDYMRIQDPDNIIPENEPVFLIRGKDIAGPDTVRDWANRAELLGADPVIINAARNQALAMELYQSTENVVAKIPDMNVEDVNIQEHSISGIDDAMSIINTIKEHKQYLIDTLPNRYRLFNHYLKEAIAEHCLDGIIISFKIPVTEFKSDDEVDFIRDLGYKVTISHNLKEWTVTIV